MNREENKLLDNELKTINGGYDFRDYGVWDKMTDEERELIINMNKRLQELSSPDVPFDDWYKHAVFVDKTERRLLLKYGVTCIPTEDL